MAAESYENSKLMLIGIVVSIFMALWMNSYITHPMNDAITEAETVAAGDLMQQITASGNNKASRLMDALIKMQHNLRGALSHISNSSDQLASAAEELNSVAKE